MNCVSLVDMWAATCAVASYKRGSSNWDDDGVDLASVHPAAWLMHCLRGGIIRWDVSILTVGCYVMSLPHLAI